MSFEGKRLTDAHKNNDQQRVADQDNEKFFHNNASLAISEEEYLEGESARVHFYMYLFIFFLAIFSFWLNGQYYIQQVFIPNEPLVNHAIYALTSLHELTPKKYLDADQLKEHSQLPFCVLIPQNLQSYVQEEVQESLNNQKYENFIVVETGKILEQIGSQQGRNQYTFQQLHTQIKQKCQQKAILFFVSQPLKSQALSIMNYHYQTYNTWLVYDLVSKNSKGGSSTAKGKTLHERIFIGNLEDVQKMEVLSVYKKVFDMIETNDFTNINAKLIGSAFNKYFVMSALLELSKYFSLPLPASLFFQQNIAQTHSFVSYSSQNKQIAQSSSGIKRIRYQPLHSLVQNYKIQDIRSLNQNRELFFKSKVPLTEKYGFFDRKNVTSHQNIEKALQLKEAFYLPDNHSLYKLQVIRLNLLYEMQRYQQTQLPLCLTINSHNNVQNDHYKRVLDSIVAQNYSNFNIVLIDDFSTDGTLEKTKDYLEKTLKFPKERVRYVKNLVQKGTTFNILNAAFNYCSKDSIQVKIDGDDQMIGKLKLQLINAQFQAHDIWVFFNFYINDQYKEGVSLPFKSEYYKNKYGGRKYEHVMGHSASFKVDLIRKIPLREHTFEVGNLLQRLSDTALQYPLFEMSGEKRVSYADEVGYLHLNSNGQNDSNLLAEIGKVLADVFIAWRSPLAQLASLEGEQEKEVRELINKVKDIDFIELK